MPNPRYLRVHIRRARAVSPGLLLLWREIVIRRQVSRQYRLRDTGQTILLRHRTPDMGGLLETVVDRNYDSRRVDLLLAETASPLRLVDLGANIGLFSMRIQARRRDVTVVAVEADRANAAVLRAVAAANGYQWQIVEACAATHAGTVRFLSGHFTTSGVSPAGQPTEAVDVFPYLAAADIIKMDIEGAEMALLEDSRFADLRAKIVLMEYHPPHPRNRVLEALDRAGYCVDPFEERLPGIGELCAWRP